MKNKVNRNVYVIYSYNQFKNDYTYIKEYTSIKELKESEQLKHTQQVYDYLLKSINEPIKHLLHNKYIILKDTL